MTRLDLLKVVGSSPARLASPEANSPARPAGRSRAVQIWSWLDIPGVFGCLTIGFEATSRHRNYSLDQPAFVEHSSRPKPLSWAWCADTVAGLALNPKSKRAQDL